MPRLDHQSKCQTSKEADMASEAGAIRCPSKSSFSITIEKSWTPVSILSDSESVGESTEFLRHLRQRQVCPSPASATISDGQSSGWLSTTPASRNPRQCLSTSSSKSKRAQSMIRAWSARHSTRSSKRALSSGKLRGRMTAHPVTDDQRTLTNRVENHTAGGRRRARLSRSLL